MPEPTPHHDGPLRNPLVRSETSDVSFRGVMMVIGAALALGLVIFIGVSVFFHVHQRQIESERASAFPLAPGPNAPLPPSPRLEQVDRLSRGESPLPTDESLHRYGRMGEDGFVRVPIERAIERLAGTLPSRAEPDADQARRAGGLLDEGAPNSGRVFRKEKP